MTMEVLEQYVLDAEKAFEDQDYLRGRDILIDALAEEPTYGKAHNHLGWLYLYHFHDFNKAEDHLKLALKYAPFYSAPYKHMTGLLFDSKRFDEHIELLEKAKTIPAISNAFIYDELGKNAEVHGDYRQAIKLYKRGIKWSMDTQEITVLKDSIRRCRDKKWLVLFR